MRSLLPPHAAAGITACMVAAVQLLAMRLLTHSLTHVRPHAAGTLCATQFQLLEGSYEQRVEQLSSPSYPGLPTTYTMHRAAAALPCLPRGPFETREQRPGGELVTWWEWRRG